MRHVHFWNGLLEGARNVLAEFSEQPGPLSLAMGGSGREESLGNCYEKSLLILSPELPFQTHLLSSPLLTLSPLPTGLDTAPYLIFLTLIPASESLLMPGPPPGAAA